MSATQNQIFNWSVAWHSGPLHLYGANMQRLRWAPISCNWLQANIVRITHYHTRIVAGAPEPRLLTRSRIKQITPLLAGRTTTHVKFYVGLRWQMWSAPVCNNTRPAVSRISSLDIYLKTATHHDCYVKTSRFNSIFGCVAYSARP